MHRSHRLRKNEEFQKVFQKGKSAANKQFVIYTLENQGQATFRIGISASKKIGNAVTRNKVKRLLKEAIAAIEDRIKPHLDIIVIVRPGVEEMPLASIQGSLMHALKRAKAIKAVEIHNEKRG
ncbi:ribonuclease P protein component [Brevibacillus sp. 7WMA2]|uniref:Ribonuclease P protein component n=3 Tax=Brevibacillus TaxID=55080 RepID=A0A075RC20_BRELA|nr:MULTISPECIES: ribonuclease P protein component [Brevibacillus]AIG28926.1 ribonuclease P protein component [Brevibacillus laterosporus LMG 15441]AKF93706.1 ribonuclease P [Brevibacillus laterosporus]AUM67231.1 ribonuclease P protein component [Brevibacillus laterosporus]AYK06093.1 ribonuclease P protein component [Brevibacillus laterosporus]ERM16824.1 ribonuclease P [Brevibacillus laterosporus PE36]